VYFVAAFCCFLGIVYGFTRIPQSPAVDLGLRGLPLLVVAHWLVLDGRSRRDCFLETWGVLFYFAWPLILPAYALRTRGRAGWELILELYGLILASGLGTIEGRVLRLLLLHHR